MSHERHRHREATPGLLQKPRVATPTQTSQPVTDTSDSKGFQNLPKTASLQNPYQAPTRRRFAPGHPPTKPVQHPYGKARGRENTPGAAHIRPRPDPYSTHTASQGSGSPHEEPQKGRKTRPTRGISGGGEEERNRARKFSPKTLTEWVCPNPCNGTRHKVATRPEHRVASTVVRSLSFSRRAPMRHEVEK